MNLRAVIDEINRNAKVALNHRIIFFCGGE
jgi:hypothetical protein